MDSSLSIIFGSFLSLSFSIFRQLSNTFSLFLYSSSQICPFSIPLLTPLLHLRGIYKVCWLTQNIPWGWRRANEILSTKTLKYANAIIKNNNNKEAIKNASKPKWGIFKHSLIKFRKQGLYLNYVEMFNL